MSKYNNNVTRCGKCGRPKSGAKTICKCGQWSMPENVYQSCDGVPRYTCYRCDPPTNCHEADRKTHGAYHDAQDMNASAKLKESRKLVEEVLAEARSLRNDNAQLRAQKDRLEARVERAAVPGEKRIGDTERRVCSDKLSDHYAAGRLTLDEFDDRIAKTLVARVQSELDRLLTDLPTQHLIEPAETLAVAKRTAAIRAPVQRSTLRRIAVLHGTLSLLGLILIVAVLITLPANSYLDGIREVGAWSGLAAFFGGALSGAWRVGNIENELKGIGK